MNTTDKVLIVEDDGAWAGAYQRVAGRLGVRATVVRDLAEARGRLEREAFAMAFVDIRLDEHDDKNIDGLRVLEFMRDLGDHTRAVVATGHGTLAIGRDAVRKYDAFDVLEKQEFDPAGIADLMRRGLEDYRRGLPKEREPVREFLRGNVASSHWDDRVLRATHPRGGVATLYKFLEDLFVEFLPAVRRSAGEPAVVDEKWQVVTGEYWSRAMGEAILLVFGARENVDHARSPALGDGVLGHYRVGKTLSEQSHANLSGVVLELSGSAREHFSG